MRGRGGEHRKATHFHLELYTLLPREGKENEMSWSVNASGKIADVRGQLSEQFKGPLAEKPAGLYDDGERKTVEMIRDSVDQCLSTFGPDKTVSVIAFGHMGFADYETKKGGYQEVTVSIKPGN